MNINTVSAFSETDETRIHAIEDRLEAHKIALTDIVKQLGDLESLTNQFRPLGPRPLEDSGQKEFSRQVGLAEAARASGINLDDNGRNVIPPVDRSARVLTDGSTITDDHRELRPDGQQKGYIVLTPAERAKGFVRPVRRAYIHVGAPPLVDDNSGMDSSYKEGDYSRFEYPIRGGVKPFPGGCLTRTEMGLAIAETYARDPKFYGATFCCSCRTHLPLAEFIWEGTTERVGS